MGHYSFVAKPKLKFSQDEVLKLDIGCGAHKEEGFIGLDKEPLEGVDIVHNFNFRPWPIPDNTFTLLSSAWAVQYADDFYEFFDEAWRILKTDGQFRLVMPYGVNNLFLRDPRSQTFAIPQTFWTLDPDRDFYQWYKPKPWKVHQTLWAPDGALEILLSKRKEV